jgi:hypothetical protein
MFDDDLGPHRLESFDVLVDRALADCTAPRQRDPCPAKPGDQRAQHQNGRPHGSNQFVGRSRINIVGCNQNKALRNRAIFGSNLSPHALQQSARCDHIPQTGHLIHCQGLGSQESGTQDRQCRILCARHWNFTRERSTAHDPKSIHAQ